MYDLLLSGGTIITCNNSFDIIEDGIIGVKDNKISLIESIIFKFYLEYLEIIKI